MSFKPFIRLIGHALDNAARRACATRASRHRAIRTIRIWVDVNNEGASILIEHAEWAGREGDPARGRMQQSTAISHLQVYKITRVEWMISVG